MEKETILVVDDEKEIRELIEIYLKNDGYQVILAANGEEALDVLREQEVHLIILDVMMPKMDGIQACLKIREEKNMPIIMLSAKTQEIDKIHGLNTGADDYVGKPFHPLELMARVKSQLRRYTQFHSLPNSTENTIVMDDLVINTETREVRVSGKVVKLTPTEFGILELLASYPGVVFSSERIYERVWKEPFYHTENTVMVHIRKIREKIEENPRKPHYIKTVWGVGYKFESEKKMR